MCLSRSASLKDANYPTPLARDGKESFGPREDSTGITVETWPILGKTTLPDWNSLSGTCDRKNGSQMVARKVSRTVD